MSTRPLRILVVDDDPAMVGAITALVGTEGHQVITAYDGLTAVKRFREEHPDLVLLDLAMPGPDGFNVAGQMRAVGPAPILVVSGESGEAAKVRALGLGADDYLTKPFGKAELLARIAAVMRRVDRTGGPGSTSGGPLTAGDLVLEPGRHEARVGDQSLTLTPTEFRLLEALVRAGGDIVPHLQLARAGWPAETDPDLLWLKPHLARLRSKVAAAGGPQVVAVRGVGYRIVVEDERAGLTRTRRTGGGGQTGTEIGRPVTSWAASAQSIRQPRASRPPSGLKCMKASPVADRRQPHAAHVTGASRPSRTADGRWVSGSEGWIIRGDLPGGLGKWPGTLHPEVTLPHVRSRVGLTGLRHRRRYGDDRVAVGLRCGDVRRGRDRHRLDQPEACREVRLVEQPAGERGTGRTVRLEETDELDDPALAVGAVGEGRGEADGHHAAIVECGGVAPGRVVEIGPAAGHPGPEVGTDRTEDDDRAAGHVFAAVRADPLDHGLRAAVADREAHPRPPDEVEPAGGRAIEHGVAGDRLR